MRHFFTANWIKRYCCAVLCALVLASVLPRNAAAADDQALHRIAALTEDLLAENDGYDAVLYDNTSGLPTSEANDIVETAEGFIWIGSYSGLIRYDGLNFERVDSTAGIASVVSLYMDSRERLWIGTNDSGVAVMDRGEIRTYTRSDGLLSNSVRSIVEDSTGTVYIATTEGMAMVGEDMVLRQIEDPLIRVEYLREVALSRNDVIYGVGLSNTVYTIKGGEVLGTFQGRDEAIMSLLPDPDHQGYVYLGTDQSVIYYGDIKSGFHGERRIDVSPLEHVNDMCLVNGMLWVCADNGIGVVTEDGFRLLENLPMDNSIDHMMVDYEGNLWFTSSRQGVMKIVPNQFMDLFARFDLPAAVVNSTCRYGDLLFIGTDTGPLALAANGEVTAVPIDGARTASGQDLEETDLLALLSQCRIRSVISDSRGNVWFSTYSKRGLVRYDGHEAVCFTSADGLPSDRIRAVYERQNGAIMAACRGGVAIIEGDAVTAVYGEESGIINTEILTVAETAAGEMLLGSDGDGIYVLSDGGKARHIGTDDGLTSDIVMRIKPDRTRDVSWIVTSNSLAYMTADGTVNTVNRFPYSNNFDLYENSRGQIWVLSSNGIYVVDAAEMLANGDIHPTYYGRNNGCSVITTANSYSDLTAEGELYIAGTTGVARVNIETPFDVDAHTKMAVPYVSVGGQYIYADENGVINVPAGDDKLTVYGYVYTYSLLDPQITYCLEGLDSQYTAVNRSAMTPIDYTNLPGGTYRFVMRLQGQTGLADSETSVTIVKQMELREHLWYRLGRTLLGMAAIAAVVLLYTRRKTRLLEQKQKENRAFIKEMTEAFAKTIDMKDKYTNGHSIRVAHYTAMLTRELGYDEETVEKYYNIALLHDIGKIGIPEEVLNKPGKLTDEEYHIIQSHAQLGYNVLKDISIMPELAIGAGAHHERPDGRGYPRGLKQDEIPRVAQIIAVADTFDAMYSNRPYRPRMNFDKVVEIIRGASGTQLTPDVVDAFLRLAGQGKLRAKNDTEGGGSFEEIDNLNRGSQSEKPDDQSKTE